MRKVVRTAARRVSSRLGDWPSGTPRRSGSASKNRAPKMQAPSSGGKKKASAKAAPKPKTPGRTARVRVWWPPTKNKKRTDYSGAYWPAKVIDRFEGGCRVEYDNGDREDVDAENVSPATVPVDFGQERTRLQAKEYCEVFNDSASDPAAWLARIKKSGRGTYTVEFPFHDTSPEVVKEERVRRARIYEPETKAWKVINPVQEWEEGEVTSPVELELCPEDQLKQLLKGEGKKEEPKLKVARKGALGARKVFKAQRKKPEGESTKKRQAEKGSAAPEPPLKAPTTVEAPSDEPLPIPSAVASGSAPPIPNVLPAGQIQLAPNLQLPPGMILTLPGARPGSPPLMVVPQATQALPNLEVVGESSVPKRKKDPNAPKKAKSPYIIFMERHRPDLKSEGLGNQEIMKHLADMWHKASWDEKAECQKEADKDRERYERELKDYVPTPVEAQREVKKRKKDKDAPKKPLSPYILFSKDFREKLATSIQFTEATRLAADAWRNVDEETKKKYVDKAAVLREKYQKEKEEYRHKREQESKESAQRQLMVQNILPSQVPYTIPSPQTVGAPALPQAPPDPAVKKILGRMDLNRAKVSILRSFTMEAYYCLLDAWREGSPRLGDAMRAYKAHIQMRDRHDWRAFFVSVFGFDRMQSLLRKETPPKSTPPRPAQPSTDGEEQPGAAGATVATV